MLDAGVAAGGGRLGVTKEDGSGFLMSGWFVGENGGVILIYKF